MKELTAEDAKNFTKASIVLCKDKEMENVYIAIRIAIDKGQYMVKFKIQFISTIENLKEKGFSILNSLSEDACYISWA